MPIMSFTLLDSFPPGLPPIVKDYLAEKDQMRPFYTYSPTMKGLAEAAQNRQFTEESRAVLCQVLKEQAKGSNFCHDSILENIARLRSKKVFTVTTGHQVCLFGGPLFFFYKILSVIKLAEQLKEQNIDAVPVYWMATEDHDFEEVNHVFIDQTKVSWNTDQKGAVGRMKLEGISSVLDELTKRFKEDHRYQNTLEKLKTIYNEGTTLGASTRDLVQWVFGELGVVVIDADDARLKALFAKKIKAELEGQFSSESLSLASEQLSKLGYNAQVSGRDVNLFYLVDGYRERILKTANGFTTADGNHQFSQAEILDLVETNPERFSPNVVLRPLYQEVILPNLSYVGGPGETSYWLQLKEVFDRSEVPMPVVLLRDMFVISNALVEKKREQLGLEYAQWYEEKYTLINKLIRQQGSHEHLVEKHASVISDELDQMIAEVGSFEPNLSQSADTEKTRILKRLTALQKKVLRADRKRNEVTEQRIDAIKMVVEPLNTPQERVHNWLNYFEEPNQCQEMLVFSSPLKTKVSILLRN